MSATISFCSRLLQENRYSSLIKLSTMIYINLIAAIFLFFGSQDSALINGESEELVIIEQDYNKALKLASEEDKLLFIDFYTTWCAPCKKLDKLVFQDGTIKESLQKDFILLKYDAEKDTDFHLSKKHHVSSYPTGLILTPEGFVVNRQYGFPGEDALSLQKNVLEFTGESIVRFKENRIVKGYSNTIDPSNYPEFYINFINRTNTKVNSSEISNYLITTENKFSEEYFSTLIYFGRDAPVEIADYVLNNKQKYMNLYGKKDVEILLYFLSVAKFDTALADMSQEKFEQAESFTKRALSQDWVDDILLSYRKEFLKAQNKWDQVFNINADLKDKGEFGNVSINNFSWQVYEKCDDKDVIKKCIQWMKELTSTESNYAYLDTYAHLLYKSGNKTEAKDIAQLAIAAAEKENVSGKGIKALVKKL
ncbi:MAG: thioredoxin family protein [Bacteroidota bacterium]